ncbi:hypothetical protein ACLESO_47235 [Pyxidicoccus sp. 3LG]
MARDSMQPWLDRLSYGELEVADVSARSALGGWEWDGGHASSGSRSYGRPENPDIPALPATVSAEVTADSAEDMDDSDFWIASY